MPESTAANAITVTLSNPQPKKHSVRYDATSEDAAVQSIYLSRKALPNNGTPAPSGVVLLIQLTF